MAVDVGEVEGEEVVVVVGLCVADDAEECGVELGLLEVEVVEADITQFPFWQE